MIGMTKVKNMFAGQGYEFALHNIRINGRMRGCNGYIKNPHTGKVVYLTTEPVPVSWLSGKIMFRLADDIGVDGNPTAIEHKNQWPNAADFERAVRNELDAEKPLLRY